MQCDSFVLLKQPMCKKKSYKRAIKVLCTCYLNFEPKGGGRRFGMGGGQNHRGSGGRESPAGSRGGAPIWGLGRSPPEAEEFSK